MKLSEIIIGVGVVAGLFGAKHYFYDAPVPYDALTLANSLKAAPSGSPGDLKAIEDNNGGIVRGHRISQTFVYALTQTNPAAGFSQITVPAYVFLGQVAAALALKGYTAVAKQFTDRAAQLVGIVNQPAL